jgi:hypothetical protein
MSRDQKPGKAKIVVNGPLPDSATEPNVSEQSRASTANPLIAKPPVALLSSLFVFACVASSIGFVLLPRLLQ